MHTIEVYENDHKTEIPSSFEELLPDQFLYIVEQLLLLDSKNIIIDEFYTRVLLQLMGLEYTPMLHEKEKRMLPEELEIKYCNISQLTEQCLDWLFTVEFKNKKKKTKPVMVFNFKSIKNLIPEIIFDDKTLIGPKDALSDISFGEYRYCCENFTKFHKKKDINSLYKLIAALYRPERENFETVKTSLKFDGHRREKFNRHLSDRRADDYRRIPYHIIYAIYLWFASCVNFMHDGTIEVNGNTIDLSKIYSSEGKKDDLGYAGTLFRIAEEGTFGDIDKTDEAGVYDVLLKLYQIKTDYEEYKRKNKINDTN